MSNPKLLKSQVHIRTATEADIGFIFNSWLKSYKNSAFSKYIANPVYFDLHHKVIESILKRSKVLIAAQPSDPTRIFGYVCVEEVSGTHVVHYAYTKESFRKMGLLKLLIEEAQLPDMVFYTHSTVSSSMVLPKIGKRAIYNPYLAFTNLRYD